MKGNKMIIRILAGINFLLFTFILMVLVWNGVLGNIFVSDYVHGMLLTIVPLVAIGMFVVMMDSDQ
tara:strand:- start:587 stop:784 length:198 start_codon:yes stop_codon:yes gene_type:complete